MSAFDYLIVNCNNGEVTGTNEESVALAYVRQAGMVVISVDYSEVLRSGMLADPIKKDIVTFEARHD